MMGECDGCGENTGLRSIRVPSTGVQEYLCRDCYPGGWGSIDESLEADDDDADELMTDGGKVVHIVGLSDAQIETLSDDGKVRMEDGDTEIVVAPRPLAEEIVADRGGADERHEGGR